MTMKQLFKLAMDYYDSLLGSERHLIETLNEALEAQSQEYQRLRTLVDSNVPTDTLGKAIENAQARNLGLKRKYSSIVNDYPVEVQGSSSSDVDVSTQPDSTYIAAMNFVKRFKEERAAKGKRMSWVECFSEGKKAGMFTYRNAEALRVQYSKYINKKQSLYIYTNSTTFPCHPLLYKSCHE
ncbi:hypothetical protein BJV82DRAFT_617644 [Fennellomyces sp. T-0311]|nr:hypothetical protein BJV82DRAFT_617644 [Fennellomyces sp. T-0311]